MSYLQRRKPHGYAVVEGIRDRSISKGRGVANFLTWPPAGQGSLATGVHSTTSIDPCCAGHRAGDGGAYSSGESWYAAQSLRIPFAGACSDDPGLWGGGRCVEDLLELGAGGGAFGLDAVVAG